MATVAISSDFLTAFAALPRQVQGKVTVFVNKFRNNPTASGINYEKINDAADKKMYSVRIDDTYRGVVVRQAETGVYLLLWVDHHDKAYDWARRKKCEVNPVTGNVQVFDIQHAHDEVQAVAPEFCLFAEYSDEDLLKIGVPEEQLLFVKNIPHLTAFYESKDQLPEDAYENLEWLANEFPLDEVLAMIEEDKKATANTENLAEALQTAGSQKSFVVVEGEEELLRIMAEPLDKWRVFLHPTQRRIVERKYSGPARVLGGAGTGKTVVAMHRAKWLASRLKDKDMLLFTTFTANLAADIKDNLRKICTLAEQRRIEVVNLDAWVSQFLREQGYSSTIVYDETLNDVWDEAIALAGDTSGLTAQFYVEEWSKVVASQDAFTQDAYLKASRIGRGTRLDRKKRMQVWNVFDEYLNLLRDREIRDVDTAMYECRKIAKKNLPNAVYPCIVVDEGQDLSPNAYRLLRVLAGEEHQNDLFIVGDTHQRIYRNKANLSKCGVNIRGRSSYLRINYRTTEEIRKYAFALLKGIPFDDLDEDYDDGKICQSLTHGDMPVIENFKDAAGECTYIVSEIKGLIQNGVDAKSICLVARTHKLLNDYIVQLTQAGLRVYEIKRSKLDNRNYDGVRVATMHRVKGLEFAYMFVAAANKRIIPLASAIDHTDSPAEAESMTAEKCLLYVALTRAQKKAYITSYGTPSEFLE